MTDVGMYKNASKTHPIQKPKTEWKDVVIVGCACISLSLRWKRGRVHVCVHLCYVPSIKDITAKMDFYVVAGFPRYIEVLFL